MKPLNAVSVEAIQVFNVNFLNEFLQNWLEVNYVLKKQSTRVVAVPHYILSN